jgi:hypothetical protein
VPVEQAAALYASPLQDLTDGGKRKYSAAYAKVQLRGAKPRAADHAGVSYLRASAIVTVANHDGQWPVLGRQVHRGAGAGDVAGGPVWVSL